MNHKIRKDIDKSVIQIVAKQRLPIVSIFCEKIGFLLFDFAKFFNEVSKKCLLKSGVKERVENALKEYRQKEDIGTKIINYDRDIADVISEPIKTLNALRDELNVTENEKENAQEYAQQCYEVMNNIYQAWLQKDDRLVGELFASFGFKKHQEKVK